MSQLMLLTNPKRRRRRKTAKRRASPRRKTRAKRRRSNPIAAPRKRVRRRRRSNPSARGMMRDVTGTLTIAGTAAVGALGLDVVMGYAPIPANLKVGPLRHVTKGAIAFLLGYASKMVVKPSTAATFTQGMLTVIMHGALRDSMATFAPQVPLGEYVSGGMGWYGAGVDVGDFRDFGQRAGSAAPMLTDSFGEYVSGMGGSTDVVDVYGSPAYADPYSF